MSSFEPTSEQKAIIDYKSSRVVTANPGSGKTFTLSHIIREILEELPLCKGVIAISYTNKASKELRERCIGDGLDKKSSFFKTIDSFFISEIIFPFLPHLWKESEEIKINSYKDDLEISISEDLASKYDSLRILFEGNKTLNISELEELLSYLFLNGVLLIESVGALANYVFDNSEACKKYLKARYSHVIVDEYQDSGKEQHTFFLKLKELGLCAIAVGDINQSIYGFAGKGAEYLASLMQESSFKVFPLTRNMRCHQSIADYSLKLISSNITLSPPTETRVFHRHIRGDEKNISEWIDNNVSKIMEKYNVKNRNEIAILIRNDRSGRIYDESLVTPHKYLKTTKLERDSSPWSLIFRDILYYLFLVDETKSNIVIDHIADIKKSSLSKISTLLDDLKKSDPNELSTSLDSFINIASLILPDDYEDGSVGLLKDVLSDSDLLNSFIPPSSSQVQILTLHKSKGLEFKVVLHVDLVDYVIPGYQGVKGNEYALKQDLNLHYVGITRAIEVCVLLSSSHRVYSNGSIGDASPSKFFDYPGLNSLRNSK